MDFKKGDSVLVLDEDFAGIVKNVTDGSVSVETSEGFILNFTPSELVLDSYKESLKPLLTGTININKVILEKEQLTKKSKLKESRRTSICQLWKLICIFINW